MDNAKAKEKLMPALTKLMNVAVLAGLTIGLTACNGNPFKTQSNPTEDYQSLIESSRPTDEAKNDLPVEDANNTQFACGNAFTITVVNDQSVRLMSFVEDVELSYTILIHSLHGANFQVTAEKEDLPGNSSFLPLSNSSKNTELTKAYEFKWKPTKADTKKDSTPKLMLRYTSDLTKSKCPTADVRDGISIEINSSSQAPILVFNGLPQTNSVYGDKFDFTVEINDPSSTQDSPPTLSFSTFKESVNSGERPASELILNAENAVKCDRTKISLKEGTSTWVVPCSFDTTKVEGTKSSLDKGVTRQASFWLSAQSSRSKQSSELTGQDILIDFPAKAETTTVPAQGAN